VEEQRLVLDASAGVEVLDRSFTGRRLSKDVNARDTSVGTVEHVGAEVARVLPSRRARGQPDDAEAIRRVAKLVNQWDINLVGPTGISQVCVCHGRRSAAVIRSDGTTACRRLCLRHGTEGFDGHFWR
jgi:predicted nucleic acid-binding protein